MWGNDDKKSTPFSYLLWGTTISEFSGSFIKKEKFNSICSRIV